MEERFNLLRSTICCDDKELNRFRQLVINSVMATDLGDKELKQLRNSRWETAFANDEKDEEEQISDTASNYSSVLQRTVTGSATAPPPGYEKYREAINRKATIVVCNSPAVVRGYF